MENSLTESLIKKLSEKTAKGEISWKTTADEDGFFAHLSNYSLSISEDTSVDSDSDSLITIHILKIYNQDGEIIEEINAGDIAEFFGNYYEAKIVLQNIFREARRIAKGSYKAIEDILKSLD